MESLSFESDVFTTFKIVQVLKVGTCKCGILTWKNFHFESSNIDWWLFCANYQVKTGLAKGHNLLSYFLFSKKFRKYFILLPPFHLIMWFMKLPKNFEKHEVWCANIAPKLKNIRNTLRKQGFFWHFFKILMIFQSFAFLGQF